MSSGDRETRPAGGARRWLPAAAILAVALLLALRSGSSRDSSGTPAEQAGADSAPRGIPAADTPDASPTAALAADAATPTPTALAAGHAFLRVMVEDVGLAVAAPYVRVTSRADGSHDVRSLGAPLEAQWPSIPAGAYTLEAVGDAWTVDEPEITLTGGEMRTVTMSSRRTAVVRVVGGISGKLVATKAVHVWARAVGSEQEQHFQMTSLSSSTDGRFVLMGLPSELVDARAIGTLRIAAYDGGEEGSSEWLEPAAIEASPSVTIRMPEPVVVGRVTRAAAGDGVTAAASASIRVELRPVGDKGRWSDVDEPSWSEPEGGFSYVTDEGSIVGYADGNGAYELRMEKPPTGPVHVMAANGIDEAADSGALELKPSQLPLHLDLVLPASSVLDVTVRMGLATTTGGRATAPWRVHVANARRLGADGAPTQDVHYAWESHGSHLGTDSSTLDILMGKLEPGDYQLDVELEPELGLAAPPPARRFSQRVHVEAGAATKLTLDATTPSSGATVSGRALLPPGLPAEAVRATLSLGHRDSSARLSSDGSFAFADVPPGDFALELLSGADFEDFPRRSGTRGTSAGARLTVHVEHGDVLLPPLDLTRPELRVTAAPDARMVIVERANGDGANIPLDDTGHGSLFGLPPGRYTARTTKEGAASTSFEVSAGASVVTVDVP
jgi:hypothetical protein